MGEINAVVLSFNVFLWLLLFTLVRSCLFTVYQRKYLGGLVEEAKFTTSLDELDRIASEIRESPDFYPSVFDLRKWTYKQFFNTNLL